MAKILSIGAAAELAGVSVQTLRHYDKLGLLVPSRSSSAGYRRYSESDRARLETIRALREVGFDLATIARLLDAELDPEHTVKLRLDAIDTEQRALKRREWLLRAALKAERREILARLQQTHVLAKLDRLEREDFLAKHLGWKSTDSPASQAVWRAAIFDLPEEVDDAQLEAWMELAEIVADGSFREALERQLRLTKDVDEAKSAEWAGTSPRLFAELAREMSRRSSADDCVSPGLLDAWIQGLARLHSRAPDTEFVRWWLEHVDSAHDPRMPRYWHLIAKIKRMPASNAYAQAFDWLLSSLRASLPRKPAAATRV
jgi:DNA-binding transcriptional MerR regulator